MLRAIEQSIRRHGLFRSGDHVLVAVSGGADSVALAYILHYLAGRFGISLVLAHLHHGIRGKDADRDADFVSELAWRLGLECVRQRADVPALARASGISLEMAAREARYSFFASTAREMGASCIASGHTADDQAETVLLRVARGTGPQGLAGIARATERDGVRLLRPLLDVTHARLVGFLRRHGLDWREDQTNASMEFLRNRVRHKVLPLLEDQLNPSVRRALLRAADIMRDENDWLEGVVSGLLAGCRANDKSNGLTISALVQLPIAARRRVLRMWLASSNVKMERVDFDAIDGIERLLPRAGGMKVVELTGGWRVVRRYDNLAIERAPEGSVPSFEAQLNVGGETLLPEHGMRVFVKRGRGIAKARGGGVGEFPAEASLSASAVRGSRVILRSWRHGDRIKPMGMAGSKKLQDVFVDEKVPRDLRCHVPVIECRGEVVWVPGYRVARGWEVRPNEERLSIRIEQI